MTLSVSHIETADCMAHDTTWKIAWRRSLIMIAAVGARPLIMQQILLVIEGNADQLAWWAPPPERVWLLAFALFCRCHTYSCITRSDLPAATVSWPPFAVYSAMTWTFCNVHFNYLVMNKVCSYSPTLQLGAANPAPLSTSSACPPRFDLLHTTGVI